MKRIAPWLLLLAAGCEASVPSCPGEVQGTFDITGVANEQGTTCPFSLAAIATARASGTVLTIGFVASVSWLDAGTAALCVPKPLASTKSGPRTGDAFTVYSSLPQITIASCPCPVDLQETLSGTVIRAAGAGAVGIRGTLVDHFTRSAGSDGCYASAAPAVLAGGCPAAPDPAATPPSDGGCDAAWDLSTPAAGP